MAISVSASFDSEHSEGGSYDYTYPIVPTRSSLIVHAAVATVVCTLSVGCALYFLITGKRVHGDDGQDTTSTVIAVLGVFLLILWGTFFHSYRRYKNTTGTTSLFEDPDTASMYAANRWEVSEDPNHRVSVFPMIFFSFLAFISLVSFIVTTLDAVAGASNPKAPSTDPPESQTGTGYWIVMLVTLIFTLVFGSIARKETSKFMYQRKFSSAPLISGVYSEDSY